jgi:hypothetical protein
MAKPFRGVINVDVTKSMPYWGPYTQPIAPEGRAWLEHVHDRQVATSQST